MTKAYFQDYYGQHIHVTNETASGNIRINVKTFKSLNEVKIRPENECDVETDISLNEHQLKVLIGVLASMEYY